MTHPPEPPGTVTELLVAYSSGDEQAMDKLFPLVYAELRRLANSYLKRERPSHTLQPTALVHEAYLRLVDQEIPWQNRSHFFGIAARTMRQILVDHARHHLAEKRGAGQGNLPLDEAIDLSDERAVELIALDEALKALATIDPQKCRLVELRFFAGLSIEETAQILGVSVQTVVRQWRTTKAWLQRELNRE